MNAIGEALMKTKFKDQVVSRLIYKKNMLDLEIADINHDINLLQDKIKKICIKKKDAKSAHQMVKGFAKTQIEDKRDNPEEWLAALANHFNTRILMSGMQAKWEIEFCNELLQSAEDIIRLLSRSRSKVFNKLQIIRKEIENG